MRRTGFTVGPDVFATPTVPSSIGMGRISSTISTPRMITPGINMSTKPHLEKAVKVILTSIIGVRIITAMAMNAVEMVVEVMMIPPTTIKTIVITTKVIIIIKVSIIPITDGAVDELFKDDVGRLVI